MKPIFFPILRIFCAVATVSLGACATQPDGVARNHRNPQSANQSGLIPSRDDRNAREVATTQTGVGGANGEEYRVPTGSNLPQKYNRRAYTTDAEDPSYVYDQSDIRLQSTNNVGDSLRSVPGVSVGGSR